MRINFVPGVIGSEDLAQGSARCRISRNHLSREGATEQAIQSLIDPKGPNYERQKVQDRFSNVRDSYPPKGIGGPCPRYSARIGRPEGGSRLPENNCFRIKGRGCRDSIQSCASAW